MIDQLTGMTPLTGTERSQRPQVNGKDSGIETLVSGLQSGMDSTSLSPAARAMVRNVQPAGASVEQGATSAQKNNEAGKGVGTRIDIRV